MLFLFVHTTLPPPFSFLIIPFPFISSLCILSSRLRCSFPSMSFMFHPFLFYFPSLPPCPFHPFLHVLLIPSCFTFYPFVYVLPSRTFHSLSPSRSHSFFHVLSIPSSFTSNRFLFCTASLSTFYDFFLRF